MPGLEQAGASHDAHRCEVCGYDLVPDPAVTCPECGSSPPQRAAHVERVRRRWHRLSFAAATALLTPFALTGLIFAWFAFPNIGLHFGYYGELNRALAALRARPNVTVTDYGANYDITLEDYSIDVRVSNRWIVRLDVPDETDFSRARCVVVYSMNGVSLGSAGQPSGWSGLAFSLGPGGDLEAILGKAPTSVADAVASLDKLASYIASTSPARGSASRGGVLTPPPPARCLSAARAPARASPSP